MTPKGSSRSIAENITGRDLVLLGETPGNYFLGTLDKLLYLEVSYVIFKFRGKKGKK